MRRIVLFRGMRRSGNHAVINWLRGHEYLLFYNNIIPIEPILRGKESLPETEDFSEWLSKRHLTMREHLTSFVARPSLRKPGILASIEDHELDIRPFCNAPCPVMNLLLVRDPANMLASRIRLIRSRGVSWGPNVSRLPEGLTGELDRLVGLWKKYAREFLGDTDLLNGKVPAYFDSWFENRDYRRAVSAALGMRFTDRRLGWVSRAGGGSSFDKTRYRFNGRRMDVLNRVSYLEDEERELVDRAIDEEELQSLVARIRQASTAQATGA